MNHSSDPILIIGGGIGGLSAAIHLAARGRRVHIFEQNPQVGGKMSERRADGFRWDTGPSVITMRHVFDDLFRQAGRRLEDYLTLLPVEPLTRYFYPDGVVLDASRHLDRMIQQIERLHPRDVEGYLAFLAYAARLHRITGDVFIYNEPPTLRSFLKVSPLDALRVDGLRTMQQAIRGFVRDPHLQQLLGRFATYVGASPYLAPATLNVIAHVEMSGGIWYPQGGIYSIAQAMTRLATELNVDIHTSTPVHEIVVKNRQVQGLITADGQFHASRTLIANVDVATVYEKLLPPHIGTPRQVRRLLNREPSCSGFILLLGVKKSHPHLAHHNIFFSSDYPREFKEIFEQGIPPTEPTIYVSITSKADPIDAPSDHENWFVLVNAPALGTAWDWDQQAIPYRHLILDRLANTFNLDVRDQIISEHHLTPHDLERLTGARRGALYGASSNNRWAAFMRPHNKSREVHGLFFAGGTTHPGGGVPMVTISGKVAAKMVLDC